MAFGIEGFNYQETPGLQRRLQKIRAQDLAPGASRLAEKQAIQEHTGGELSKYLSSRENRRAFDTAKQMLSNQRSSLDIQRESGLSSHLYRMAELDMERQKLQDLKDQQPWHRLFGLGGMGLSLYQNKRERERAAELRDMRERELWLKERAALGIPYIPAR
jgi:hypothetical protein